VTVSESRPIAREPRRVAVTGATGYVGDRIARLLAQRGWIVRSLGRRAAHPTMESRRFVLGEPIAPAALADCDALVHCAHDFDAHGWDEIRTVNGIGSCDLFRAARTAGIESIVFISSMSAFDGCKSDYGRVKLFVENESHSLGVLSIRPGLVFGEDPGGMVGALARMGRTMRVVPLPDGGMQRLYLTADRDLALAVENGLEGRIDRGQSPITIASDGPILLRDVVRRCVYPKRIVMFPVPSEPIFLVLRALEAIGIRSRLRSDGLVGLLHTNPAPDLSVRSERPSDVNARTRR